MATLQDLGAAIAQQPQPPRQVFCGFDLWLEAMGSGKLKLANFLKGGVPAKGDEPEGVLKVPLMVAGRNIVIGLDVTLPPDGFRIAP
jgi:hypothetical protein